MKWDVKWHRNRSKLGGLPPRPTATEGALQAAELAGQSARKGTAKHPGAVELAHLVAKLAGGSVNATDRERAVVLALERYRIEEISQMKLLESRGPQDRFRPSSPPQYKPVEDEPLGDL